MVELRYLLVKESFGPTIEVNTLHPPYIVFSPAFYARGSKERPACLLYDPLPKKNTKNIYMSRALQVDSHCDIEVFS